MEPKNNLMKILGIAFAAIIFLLVAILYVKAAIDEKVLAVQQLRNEMQAREVSLSDLAPLQGEAEKARQYAPELDRLFTSKDQLLAFSTDIGFLAKQAGFLGAPQFKEEAAPLVGDLQKINFSLLLEGEKGFSDLATFLRLVEQSKYFVRLTTLDVSRDGNLLRLNASGYVLSFER